VFDTTVKKVMLVDKNDPDARTGWLDVVQVVLFSCRWWMRMGGCAYMWHTAGFWSGLIWPFYVGRYIAAHLTQLTY